MTKIADIIVDMKRNPKGIYAKFANIILAKHGKQEAVTGFIRRHGPATRVSIFKMIKVWQRHIRLDRC